MSNEVSKHRPAGSRLGSSLIVVALTVAIGGVALNQSAAGEEEESPLYKLMNDKVNESYKQLRRVARTGNFDDETIKLVHDLQAGVVQAKTLEPPIIAKAPAAEQPKLRRSYQHIMAKLLREAAEIEVNIYEGKTDAVKEGINNLALIKKEGHDIFVPE
jgi:hypothetical protein